LVRRGHQQVGGLDVSVGHGRLVKVLDAGQDLIEKFFGVNFRVLAVGHLRNLLQNLLTFDELQHLVDFPLELVVEEFNASDDVWVVQFGSDGELLLVGLLFLLVRLARHLHREWVCFLFVCFFEALKDSGVHALAQLFSEVVVRVELQVLFGFHFLGDFLSLDLDLLFNVASS